MMTRAGVERIMRFAFRLAQSRPRKLLTVVTKSNAQRHGMVLWDQIAGEVAREFPDVRWDKELVDAATARMVNRPASLDTLVATNLHADILSDLAAALAGTLARPRATSIRSAATPACSSRSTARPSTSWARAWPTPWARSGAA
ncbi:Isocitrate dehydrogenase [NAD] subunit gamma, mitochondrial [Manis javanica]|nr:Isocitrate dehydrogenase [NAD] subunit gamma, mitochondrial [Manis javanica]